MQKITRKRKRRNRGRFFNRGPERVGVGSRQTTEEFSFQRSKIRKSSITKRAIGRPQCWGVRRFSTLIGKVTFYTREKGTSDPGRVRRGRNKFTWNSKANDLKKGKFKS